MLTTDLLQIFVCVCFPFLATNLSLSVVSAVPAERSPSLDQRYAMLGGGEHNAWAFIYLQIQ